MKNKLSFAEICCRNGVTTITIEPPCRKGSGWAISLHAIEESERFEGRTYRITENKALNYILPDRPTTKEGK